MSLKKESEVTESQQKSKFRMFNWNQILYINISVLNFEY